MQRRRSGRWARQHFALWFAILALTVRLLVPGGFMPVTRAGVTTIVLCSGHGPMDMEPKAEQPHKTESGKSTPSCGFDLLGSPALDSGGPALPAAAVALLAPLAPIPTARTAVDLPERLRPPLRAPPRLLPA